MRHNQSLKWHQDIGKAAVNFKPYNFTPLDCSQVVTLPLAQFRTSTDFYLRRKGNLKPDKRDRLLISLVREHPRKDVAIVACAHALSTPAARDLITRDCPVDPVDAHDGFLPYLLAITGTHYANPTAISEAEAQLAQALILLSSEPAAVGQHLNTYFSVSSRTEPSDLFRPPFVEKILHRACARLGQQLDTMRDTRQWKNAYEESSWFSGVLTGNPTAGQLLNRTIPTWRIWALWRPNAYRLGQWERFTPEQRGGLRDILALEGPDFKTGEKETLREGLVRLDPKQPCSSIRHERLVVKLENGSESAACTMLNRLLDSLDMACSKSSSSIALFTHLCTRNPVDNEVFQLLGLVNAITSHDVNMVVIEILTAGANGKVAAAMQLLPSLNDGPGQELRGLITPSIIKAIGEEALRMQTEFCERLGKGRGDAIGKRLQEFGKILSDATWLHSSLSDGLRSALEIWPEKNDLESLFKLRADVEKTSVDANSPLPRMIDAYLMAWLAGRGTVDDEVRDTVEALVRYWQQPPEPDRCAVAFAVVQRSTISPELRIQCLAELKDLNRDFVHQASLILKKDTDMACVNFAGLLASDKWINPQHAECWRGVLLSMIRQRDATLLDYSLKCLKIQPWFQWLNDLWNIFGASVTLDPPTILNPFLHQWSKKLSERYIPVLTEWENAMGSLGGLRCILIGWEDADNVIPVLDMLQAPEGGPYQPVRLALMQKLAPDGSNGRQICQALSRLTRASTTGRDACLRVLEVRQKSTRSVAEAVMTVWLESPDLTPVDRSALRAMASILGLQAPPNSNTLRTCLQDAADHLESEYSELLDEASRLESLRLALKAHDAPRTSALLAKSGIEDLSAVEDSYSGIPAELLDVVERISNGEFEMSFLLTHLKPLNLIAHGLRNARMLLVRLILGDGTTPPRFCMHIHPEPGVPRSYGNTRGHSYHAVSPGGLAPDTHICHGRANRIIYQLSRALHRDISGVHGSVTLVHKSLTRSIDNLAHTCIVCGNLVGAALWRSATCKKECSVLLRRSDLEVRLVDLRLDPPVVDLLLYSVHAAAVGSPNLLSQLLVGCPVSNASTLCQVVNRIPAMSTFQNAQDLTSAVRRLGSQAEALLSWLCTSYRGFLATATGALRIPSMPGVHQFVLANSAPELEEAFAKHMRRQQSSRVVFHGTSFDRLYPILRQGLRVQSGGSLQRHGASMGRGIYVGDEPSTALNYSPSTLISGWSASLFQNVRVLLGCELAGHGTSSGGVHVIADSSTMVVRYVFLFPAHTVAPIAANVVPALTSAYASLRSRSG